MNALIAVSSELISKSISNCLIHIEHSYSVAHSFSDAALMYESTQPDIVIAEITMVNEQQINLRQLIYLTINKIIYCIIVVIYYF